MTTKSELNANVEIKQPKFRHLLEEFESTKLESKYRQDVISEDWSLMRAILIAGMIAFLLYLISDLTVATQSNEVNYIIFFRALALILFILVFLTTRKITTPRQLNVVFTFIIFIAILQALSNNILRPTDYFTHIGMDVGIIILAYLSVPITLRIRLIPILFFSVSLIVMVFMHKEPKYTIVYSNFTAVILIANIFGYIVAVRIGRLKRICYTALNSEKEIRKEIKTLKGIIPICSYCKNIRNEGGAWDGLEAYIHNNSTATFSHGICPTCVPKVRKEINDLKKP